MRRLRRRTREGVEVWVYGWVEEWVRAPFYFINSGLIPDRHRYCTYLYYLPGVRSSGGTEQAGGSTHSGRHLELQVQA